MANLFSPTAAYTRAGVAATTNEIEFDFEFKSPVVFNSMTLTKTGTAGDYDDHYKNTCLSVVQNDGTSADHPKTTQICTESSFGFANGSTTGADESFDAQADIVFNGNLAGLTDVVSAKLVFDTSAASGSNSAGQTIGIAQLQLNYA